MKIPVKLSVVSEFRAFLLKQNALALAIGVVIGAAVGKVVSGIVDDLIMPIVGIVLPGGEWRNAQFTLTGNNAIKYGDLIGRLIDFVIVAFVIFFIAKLFIKEALAPTPATKNCPQCLEAIPVGATRCRACAQPV
jgi:large conductance mechanosensitive channel